MGLDLCVREGKNIPENGYYFKDPRVEYYHTGNISYSTFDVWRNWLARKLNFNLSEMYGYGGFKENYLSDKFYEIFNHSDCDGYLTYEECVKLKSDFDWFEQNILYDKNDEEYEWGYERVKKAIEKAVEFEAHIVFT